MFAAIGIIIFLYIVIWVRGPREGKTVIENRLLRHDLNYWRKRYKE